MAPILDVNNTTGDFITLIRDYIGRQYVIELLTRKVHITPQGLNTANWDILLLSLKTSTFAPKLWLVYNSIPFFYGKNY